MHLRPAFFACAVLWAVVVPSPARADDYPAERLPTGHWSYDELEELSVAGALDSLWIYARPLSRAKIATALLQAPQWVRRDPRYRRLLREFSLEVERQDPARALPYTGPILRSRSGAGELRAWPRVRLAESKGAGGPWVSDSLSEVGGQGAFSWSPHLLFYTDLVGRRYPGSRFYADPLKRGTEITTLTQQAYVSLSWGAGEGALGRDRLYWGLGQSGSLYMGDAAPAMSLFEYKLSWRRARAMTFTAQLDSYTGEYLSGHRLEWRPFDALYMSAGEVVRYQSKQPEPLYITGLIPYTFMQRQLTADALPDSGLYAFIRNNVMEEGEVAWKPCRGLRLSGTVLIDDNSLKKDSPLGRTGYQVNLVATQSGRTRPLSARLEFTRIRNYVYSVYYGRDYIHQGLSLAYPLGPDLENLTGQVGLDFSEDLKTWLSFGHLLKGEGRLGEFLDQANPSHVQPPGNELEGVVERTLSLDFGARWFARDNLSFEAGLGFRRVRNAGHVEGAESDEPAGSIALDARW